ncbi:acyltransferase [Natribacillus halophilus]|uniref:Acetyltransferase (Isoleucine patch superfamily) n=1 Tax=Natribacillus halophilus TaxID=549003 RepID=A0A1G8KM22_9BACI|nr:acyltransferase [Natribacillus halophilus]SDI44426.1 Acetyltransferase (isoleucine patch superfamily) [Natribacillus halophilus]
MKRPTERYPVSKNNSLWHLYKTVSFFKVVKNFIVIEIARVTPFLSVKNWMYRVFLRMDVGAKTAFALKVTPDLMFPEKIAVGNNCVIGFQTTLLTHEYLIEEYRLGEIHIGDNVMIGAQSLILPGVTIGDGAVVSAMTLVHKDVPPGAFVGGNPMQVIREGSRENHKEEI